MQLHEIPLFSKWYIIIAVFITEVIVWLVNDGMLRLSRWKMFTDGLITGLSFLISLACCIVLLIVDVDHPVELVIFYLFLFVSLVYPFAGLGVALIRWVFRVNPDAEVMCGLLANALKQENEVQAVTLLKKIRPGMPLKDHPVLLDALCDLRPGIRRAAAKAAVAVNTDERAASGIQSCIRGDADDFERLGSLGDTRFLKHLMKLAKKKEEPMPSATRGILAMADAGGMNAEMIRSITSLFKSSPQKTRRLILDKLMQMKDGGEVYEGLLKDSDPGRRTLSATAFVERLKKEDFAFDGAWQKAGKALAEHHRPLIAQMLCAKSPARRKQTARLCESIGMDRSIVGAVQGDDGDFDRLGRLGEAWILAHLVELARNPDDTVTFPAITGIAAMVETGTIPEVFLAFLAGFKETRKKTLVAASGIDPEHTRPITAEILEMILTTVESGLIRALCHPEAAIRIPMASVAPVLGLDKDVRRAVKGDDRDFERIGAMGDPRFMGQLMLTAVKNDPSSLSAARGVIALCNSGNLSGDPGRFIEDLILRGSNGVRDLAMHSLIDMGEQGVTVLLKLLKDPRKEIRLQAAGAMVACAQKAKAGLGPKWWTLRDLVIRPHSDISGTHQDGYHCDYDRGCTLYGCDPHSDFMTEAGTYRAHHINRRTPHTDNLGIGLSLDEE